MNYTIEGRLRDQPDILRNFMWEVDILDFTSPLSNIINQDKLSLRIKAITTPGRVIETIDTWFYGFKQSIPSRTLFDNNITLSMEETENQDVLSMIYTWMEKIVGVDQNSSFASLSSTKIIAKTMLIKLLKFNGKSTGKIIELRNVYPLSINEVTLDMSGNEAIRYDVNFNFDYWKLINSNLPIL